MRTSDTQLQQYKVLRKSWKKMLAGNDENSIWKQLETLLWYDTLYSSFSEAIELAITSKNEDVGIPYSILQLVENPFQMHQMVGIRKIVDFNWKKIDRKIYSLRRLYEEIKENRNLITRENYVSFDGIPKEKKRIKSHKSELFWTSRNRVFDQLSHKNEKSRKPGDIIHSEQFEKIEKKLNKLKLINEYVNKYLAHAADPINRKSIDKRKGKLTYKSLEQAYIIVIQIGNIIADMIGETLITELSTPQYDQFENWDKRLITTEHKNELYQFWQKRYNEINSWSKSNK